MSVRLLTVLLSFLCALPAAAQDPARVAAPDPVRAAPQVAPPIAARDLPPDATQVPPPAVSQDPVPVAVQAPAPVVPSRVGLALVIGNSKYAQAELPTVDVDRASMVKSLESIGFKVKPVENLDRPRDFEEALTSFLKEENAAPEDVLVVYYSGHGLQIDGKPHLLGTGIKASGGDVVAPLKEYSESINNIIKIMEEAAPASRVLIVDACRNNAFASAPKKGNGLTYQPSIEDTYLIFADEPGKTVPARTETSAQSPFTAGLLFALENSTGGIEERFVIAQQKTHDLSPDQTPQIYKSDKSAKRSLPFLDRGGRAAPMRSAGQMLNDAEPFYRAGAWAAFHEKVHAAQILSAEPDLNARLERELQFSELVIKAQAAEKDPAGPRWADAATTWDKAGQVFPVRPWVLEKSALAWLLGDRVQEAVDVLVRVQAYRGNAVSDRATALLNSLLKTYPPSQADLDKRAGTGKAAPAGPEFERYNLRP